MSADIRYPQEKNAVPEYAEPDAEPNLFATDIVGADLFVLEKFAVIVVAPVIVPLVDDQLENFVSYPVACVGPADTLAPVENVNEVPLAVYVAPYPTLTDVGVTVP